MIEHPQHVQRLTPFCTAIAQVLLKEGANVDRIGEIFRLGISAECVQCAIALSGEELFLLAQPSGADEHPKIKRLRLGDCARHGCDSCYYRIRFWPVAPIDWPQVLSEIHAHQGEAPGQSRNKFSNLSIQFLSFAPSPKVWTALGVIVLLLIFRQWYLGGRIPLLREPEHFTVEIAPQGDGEQQAQFQVDIDDPQKSSRGLLNE